MLISTLDYYITKIEHYILKYNKLKEEKQDDDAEESPRNKLLCTLIKKNGRSVLRQSERADINEQKLSQKVFEE